MNAVIKYLERKEEEYREFDALRFPRLFATLRPLIESYFKKPPPKIIQIVGTNGKGSTGRFLALMLHSHNKQVGHFVSPHLLSFLDRFWENGSIISKKRLLAAHELLCGFVDEKNQPYCDKASYFEYATLLAYVLFYEHEFAIIEAGLGGEFDSTTSLPKILSLITPIAIDHQERLGKDIYSIALTKLRSIDKYAIIGFQPHYEDIIKALTTIQQEKTFHYCFTPNNRCNPCPCSPLLQQEVAFMQSYMQTNALPQYQQQNLMLALYAMRFLNLTPVHKVSSFDLQGRAQRLAEHVWVDVGHNVHAAEALRALLEEQLTGQKIHLVYNTYKDKDYVSILQCFKPILARIHILQLAHHRVLPSLLLEEAIKNEGIPYDYDVFPLNANHVYVVFGSFSVAELFISRYRELYG